MYREMKEAKFVAFSTQKGGAGKTTLTVLMASYLHYVKGLNVGVVDCDFPQFSVSDMRNRDMANIKENKMLANQCSELYKRIASARIRLSRAGLRPPSRRQER